MRSKVIIEGIFIAVIGGIILLAIEYYILAPNRQNIKSDLLYQYKMLSDELQELKRKRMQDEKSIAKLTQENQKLQDEKTIAKLTQDIQKLRATLSDWELSDEEYAESQRLSALTDSLLKEANSKLNEIILQRQSQ